MPGQPHNERPLVALSRPTDSSCQGPLLKVKLTEAAIGWGLCRLPGVRDGVWNCRLLTQGDMKSLNGDYPYINAAVAHQCGHGGHSPVEIGRLDAEHIGGTLEQNLSSLNPV